VIRFEIDLGRIPSVLQALADPALVDKAVNAAAESFNDDIHDWIDSGRAFTSHGGGAGLEGAINWRPAGHGVAEVYVRDQSFQRYNEKLDYRYASNPAGYAAAVEYGSGPHVIRPRPGRKGIKIPVTGGAGYIVRREVNHPGSRPYPYMFADLDNRKERMIARVLSVLAAHAGGEHG